MERPIFIVGFMGSGKTTIGKKIANATNRAFIDLDQEIVKYTGMPIPEYFNKYGEEAFRELEQTFLLKQKNTNAIISTGGGTPCFYNNMQWMIDNGIAIYLMHTPKSLWSRLSKSDINKRPVLKGLNGAELLEFIEAKLNERKVYYELSQLKIDQIHTSVEEIIQLIKYYQNKLAQ